ncbi:hypothetical protein J6590_098563 [Homalodisca vitripennis]|nr:hypothetical protein J6590_098563 [Homalodisca vitripennis]
MDQSSFQCCILTFGAVQNRGHSGVPPAPCTFHHVLALRSASRTSSTKKFAVCCDYYSNFLSLKEGDNTTILCNVALMSAVPHSVNQTVHRVATSSKHAHNTTTASTDCQIKTDSPSLVQSRGTLEAH